MQAGEFNISGTVPISKYLLSLNPSIYNTLFGETQLQNSNIEMWVDFVNFKIRPFHEHLISPILSGAQQNEQIQELANKDLSTVLAELNSFLKLKSFLVGFSVTFADLYLSVNLYPYFTLLLDESKRSEFPNVTRHYFYVANMSFFTNVLGRPRLCKVPQQASIVPLTKLIAPVQNNNYVKKEKKIQVNKKEDNNNKNNNNNNVAPKQEVVVKSSTEDLEKQVELEKEDKRKKNELDLLPPSAFDLDGFKKEFMNTKEKAAVLEKFWKNFDAKGYSLWFVHYEKAGDQGKVFFKTNNLKNLFLQKLDKLRKYSFSVYGVYGTEPDLEVEGVWFWRGTDIPEIVIYIF